MDSAAWIGIVITLIFMYWMFRKIPVEGVPTEK